MSALSSLLVLASAAAIAQPLEASSAPETPAHFELALVPALVQVNGKFTQHVGTFGTVSWFPRERVAVQLFGGVNWLSQESAFNGELVEKFRVEAQAASSLLWSWGLFAGSELEPLVGELTVAGAPVRLGLVLSAGAGLGGTRHQLQVGSSGDTGVRFMATVAAGMRVRVGQRFIARFEVRDVGFSSRISSINGCSASEVITLADRLNRGGTGGAVSASCRGFPDPRDLAPARFLVTNPGTDILHSLGVSMSAGVVF